jgi:integrase
MAWASDKASVSDDTICEWKAVLLSDGHGPVAFNAWLAGVRAFFAWAVSARRLAYIPATAVKGATRRGTGKAHKRDALTDAEMLRVLAVPDRQYWMKTRVPPD